MQDEKNEASERLNTPEGQEMKKEQDKEVTPEEAEEAHEGAQGFGKETDEKFGS